MCDLDISERRKPQDGKINFSKFVQGLKLELRVATIPTNGGMEDAVLRLLQSSKPIPLDKLGLSERNLGQIRAAAARPFGMLLCVGPTGSGKTTTLHSLMGSINTPERKIWTAEDPVEITQQGLRQVQVNPRIEWTFAKALRAFLRADPDVIMVGEIRDKDTAEIAIRASLTGHLVFSTLHTNDAPGAITRLVDMGIEPFLVASAIELVIAQRLVRRLCTECSRPAPIARVKLLENLAILGCNPAEAELVDTLKAPVGCDRCRGTGYRGRIGIFEIFRLNDEMHELVLKRESTRTLADCARKHGMRTLGQSGWEKVKAGSTTFDEVLRVITVTEK
jgi:type II secretory ATPase GspE/PulE/Tfp pilus assembly ATPase PilB-like protein